MPLLLQLINGEVTHKLVFEQAITIGRSTDNDLSLEDKTVSAHHARLEPVDSKALEKGYQLHDLSSTNGSFVNEKAITTQLLADNDQIRLGLVSLSFHSKLNDPMDNTAKLHKSWIPGVYYTKD